MNVSKASRSARIFWAGLLILPMLASLAWAEPTQEQLEAASLLASRATFGMSYEQIVDMAEKGLDEWLDEQLNMKCSSAKEWEDRIDEMDRNGEFDEFRSLFDVDSRDEDSYALIKRLGSFNTSWYMTVRYAPDQLCQRVAWALSQIFVINQRSLKQELYSVTSYYDILTNNALGNYRQLIEDVTYSNQMGLMLSHVNNSRPRPEKKLFPDENYAREIMQLFSIGLFELNEDGTEKKNESGEFIPTYDADDIANLARVMTGFVFDGDEAQFGSGVTEEWDEPMAIHDWHHDKEEKVIVGDWTIPAGQRGYKDVEDALDVIFEHENVGPFIGRQLIQRLVTSNPEPEYVQRVAEAFNDDGLGVRGNLKHVVKTILTDPEVTGPANPTHFGKLREPVLRVMNLHRMFATMVIGEDTRGLTHPLYIPESNMYMFGNQTPLDAPSVFNFYSPFHSPKGELSDNELVAPELQIFSMLTSHQMSNGIWARLVDDPEDNEGRQLEWFYEFRYEDENGEEAWWHPVMGHDISEYVNLAETPTELVDRLDLVMTHGKLNSDARSRLVIRVRQAGEDLRKRVWLAIWYMSTLPDYIVETF